MTPSTITSFPRSGTWPSIRKDLLRERRRPVVAAVGYIGVDAPKVMPLRDGDTLICDASSEAIKARLTSAAALMTYHRRGVSIFSIEGLHAKVISSATSAWIGSANASTNSEENLIEAAARITGPSARQLHDWARGLATEENLLTRSDLQRLLAIPLRKKHGGPARRRIPRTLPDSVSRLHLFETVPVTSNADLKAVEADRHDAVTRARTIAVSTSLESIIWAGGSTARPGDWVIDIRKGHASRPHFVVRVTHHRRGDIIWLSPVTTPTRPNIAALRSLSPRLAPGFGTRLVRDTTTIAAILALYR